MAESVGREAEGARISGEIAILKARLIATINLQPENRIRLLESKKRRLEIRLANLTERR